MPARRACRALLLLVLLAPGVATARDRAPRALCTGRYAESLSAMRAAVQAREAQARADWVYCLRATAVYEHVSYGKGGRLRRQYHRKVRHGTGFAYRRNGDAWLLATNHHVTSFPDVTGEGVELEGVPTGSRKVREEVRIVSSEAEPDGPDLPLLSGVVADTDLDVAVLASSRPLELMPYRIGRSADLTVGDAVLARGYPLGAFPAANTGKVIGVGQRDLERGWDHEDFAVDALLNLGSSGSPVFAVSCETGEPELVGVYHAGYRGAQGLNVVVAVDQLRVVLDELRSRPPPAIAADPLPDAGAIRSALASGPVTFPFGGRAVRVERDGEAVRFVLLDPAFPLSARSDVAVVDRGADADPGALAELRDALRAQLALVLAWRAAESDGARAPSRAAMERLATRIRDREEEQAELVAAVELGAPAGSEVTVSQRDAAVGQATDGAGESPTGARGAERRRRAGDPQ
jgi:serine protease Do